LGWWRVVMRRASAVGLVSTADSAVDNADMRQWAFAVGIDL
jgi:hypothetical protein